MARFNRSQIRVGGYLSDVGPNNALVVVDEVEVTESGRLRVTTHVVSRALCADTLVHGERHPTVVVMV